MCDYTGRKDDPLRHSPNDLPEDVVDDMTKSLLNESLADCGRTGLSPFCQANPAPAVSHQSKHFTFYFNNFLFNFKETFVAFFQANDKFWKVKYDHEAAKKARKAKKAARRAAPRKKGYRPSASELLQLDDSSESEVTLDSLGSSFVFRLFLTTLLTLIISRMIPERVTR